MTEAIVLPQRFSVVRHPELRRLVRYYRDACAGGRMISRQALDPMLLKTVLPRVFYYDYDVATDDFRLRLAGEEIRAVLPSAKRGALVGDILPAKDAERIRGYYRRVVKEKLLLHSRGRVVFKSGEEGMGERIVVPVGDAQGRPAQIFGASFYEVEGKSRAARHEFSFELVEVSFIPLGDDAAASGD